MESNDAENNWPTTMDMDGFMEMQAYDYQQPRRGDIRQGTILSVSPNQIVVDIGVKREALVSPRDLENMDLEELANLSVGEEMPVYVVKPEDKDGNLIVSIHLARLEQDWKKAEELADSHEIWEGRVVGYNKGGLIVPFGKIRAFIPASQISDFPRNPSPDQKTNHLAAYVDQKVPVRVIEVDRKRGRLILSQRSAQKEWREKQKERLIETLQEGIVMEGTVSSLADFGAFVDIGGVDGLVHVSELAWHRVKHPRDLLKVGETVKVYVLNVDRERKRIGLSLKRLQPDPWTLVESKYKVNQLVECTITNVTDFGAFARLEEGVEGLVHFSELTDEEDVPPGDLVHNGEKLRLLVIKVDVARQRIGLSLRQVPDDQRSPRTPSQPAQPEVEGVGALQAQEVVADPDRVRV